MFIDKHEEKSTISRHAFFFVTIALAICVSETPLRATTCNQDSRLTRPIPLGVSGGNIKLSCAGGTLGAEVHNSSGTQFILATSHDFGRCNAASIGEGIVKPGENINCSHNTNDIVAHLSKYTTLSIDGTNTDDSAIAKVVSGDVSSTIENIGTVSSIPIQAFQNLPVEKMSEGTCLRNGTILQTSVFGSTPGCGGTLHYQNLLEFTMQNAPGDSGALVVTQGPCFRPVGLLIAGNSGSNLALANPIQTVLSDLSVTVTGNSCSNATAPPTAVSAIQSGPTQDEIDAGAVVKKYAPDWLKIPGVFQVGVGKDASGNIVIKVEVDEIKPELQNQVPTTLEGFPVELEKGQRPNW